MVVLDLGPATNGYRRLTSLGGTAGMAPIWATSAAMSWSLRVKFCLPAVEHHRIEPEQGSAGGCAVSAGDRLHQVGPWPNQTQLFPVQQAQVQARRVCRLG